MPEFEPERHDQFLRLYVQNEEALRGFVRSLVPTLEDARDVMQEVAVVLWKKFDTISSIEDFRPWAFGVARLEALQYLRKKGRDRHVFGDDALEILAAAAEKKADDWDAEKRALESCLEKLPQEQRTLVEEAYAPSVRIDEMAKSMGRTAMSLYKLLHRIRMALIECTDRELKRGGVL